MLASHLLQQVVDERAPEHVEKTDFWISVFDDKAGAWAAEDGFLDKRVPPPPLEDAGRLTINT